MAVDFHAPGTDSEGVVPMISFRLAVQVLADETGMTLPGLFVKACDKDLLFESLLGRGR